MENLLGVSLLLCHDRLYVILIGALPIMCCNRLCVTCYQQAMCCYMYHLLCCNIIMLGYVLFERCLSHAAAER